MFASDSGDNLHVVQPEVRYASCGDGYVAYQVVGTGPTDLLVIFADLTHIEHGWPSPATLGSSAASPTPFG